MSGKHELPARTSEGSGKAFVNTVTSAFNLDILN